MAPINKPFAYISLFIFLLFSGELFSQIILTPGNGYLSEPGAIISTIVKKEGVIAPATVEGLSLDKGEKSVVKKYVDGFGRSLQDIIVDGSPSKKDIIQIYKYDELGRQSIKYLPFESNYSGGTYLDRPAAITAQADFYTVNTNQKKIANDAAAYAESQYEESPIGRIIKQGGVGSLYQLNGSYTKGFNYYAYDGSDNILLWQEDGVSYGYYNANELSVAEGTDENGTATKLYYDKMGRLMLKRQKVDMNVSGQIINFFDTYYIYNASGNILYVIPPKAIKALENSSPKYVQSVPDLVFSYRYDSRNRLVEKKVPGQKFPVYMVYDPLDRLLFVQDNKLRESKQWYYRKYDSRNRVVIEGVYYNANLLSREDMQNEVNTNAGFDINYYEDRENNSSSYYTNNCFPVDNVEEMIYYYYDDYDLNFDGTADYTYEIHGLEHEIQSITNLSNGLLTAIKKRIVGQTNWITSISFYDKYYHLVQVRSNNQLNDEVRDKRTSFIDFAGRTIQTKTTIRTNYNSSSSSVTTNVFYSYDHMDRLILIGQEGTNISNRVNVAFYEYNAIGQLVDKKVDYKANNNQNFLQSIDYRYNIRGQLISINNSELRIDPANNDEDNDVFGMSFIYDQYDSKIQNTPCYNGLLSAVKWKADYDQVPTNEERSYVFDYNKANWLTNAHYKQLEPGATVFDKYQEAFDEKVSYDPNGNILELLRNALLPNSNGIPTKYSVDDLKYTYKTNSNQIDKLEDISSNSNLYGFKNITGNNGYEYDNSGNISNDYAKGLNISYNYMNKVSTIGSSGTNKQITYRYDAAGIRISKWVTIGGQTEEYEYIGGFEYKNGTLKHYAMAEGRVRMSATAATFEYFITDQQGNVRLSFEDNGQGEPLVKQENAYYPFGLVMPGGYTSTEPNKHLYNAGSELQDNFAGTGDIMDFELTYYSTFFREYDPVTGRFTGVDALAEMYVDYTPYQYSMDNPINLNDPTGAFALGSLEGLAGKRVRWEGEGGDWFWLDQPPCGYDWADFEEYRAPVTGLPLINLYEGVMYPNVGNSENTGNGDGPGPRPKRANLDLLKLNNPGYSLRRPLKFKPWILEAEFTPKSIVQYTVYDLSHTIRRESGFQRDEYGSRLLQGTIGVAGAVSCRALIALFEGLGWTWPAANADGIGDQVGFTVGWVASPFELQRNVINVLVRGENWYGKVRTNNKEITAVDYYGSAVVESNIQTILVERIVNTSTGVVWATRTTVSNFQESKIQALTPLPKVDFGIFTYGLW